MNQRLVALSLPLTINTSVVTRSQIFSLITHATSPVCVVFRPQVVQRTVSTADTLDESGRSDGGKDSWISL